MGRSRGRGPLHRSPLRAVRAASLGVLLAGAIPALALAHPLGNFTINHYAGLRVEPTRVLLDVVIDQAEIPTFQARIEFDADADGETSDEEIETGREAACDELAGDLSLTADGAGLPMTLQAAGLSFPPGAGGLSTMRLVCAFEAPLPAALGAEPTRIAFADASFAERIGWREIVAVGSGATLALIDGELRATSISQRLTAYPEELIAAPLADVSLTVDAVAGGPELPPATVVDAIAIDGAAPSASPGVGAVASAGPTPTPAPAGGVVPGGVSGADLPSIFRTADVTPLVLLLSVVTAAALGAGHALTPGHGKTLMAAYLVGTRGTPVHALGLGLSVSLSHTVGILVLAAVILGAADLLPPELVVRTAPVIAAVSIVAIGGWMLIGELRGRRAARVATLDHHHGGEPAHDHPHDHDHDGAQAHDHPHGPDHRPDAAGMHSHGGVTHSHLPPAGTAISWRSLFVLGLAGGLIPSTSALLILLGSIAAGRPGFGFVLVVAFGLGMAGVMAGIGLLIVAARGRLDRLPSGGGLGRARDLVPLVAAVLVFGFGLYLTAQAIAGAPTL